MTTELVSTVYLSDLPASERALPPCRNLPSRLPGGPVELCSHCYRAAQGAVKARQGCGRGSQRRRLNRGAGAGASFRARLSAALCTPAPKHRRRPQCPQSPPVQGQLGAAEAPVQLPPTPPHPTGCLGSLCVMNLPALAQVRAQRKALLT